MRAQSKIRPLILILSLAFAGLAAAQAPSEPVPPTADMMPAPPPAPTHPINEPTGTPARASSLSALMQPFEYDPRGRRDPFSQPTIDKPMSQTIDHGPILPLQKYELSRYKLNGIIWNVSQPKALLRDPDGTIHRVGLYSKVGNKNGYVAAIREGEVVIVEVRDVDGKLLSSATVVKLSK